MPSSFDPFFDYICETGVPIVCHVGDPRFIWDLATASESAKMLGRDYGDGFLSLDALYDELSEVFQKHPDVKFILAHFYFKSDDYDGLVTLMEQYPNICLDLTPGTEMFPGFSKDIEKWKGFFLRYSQRVIMGSDLYAAGYGLNRHRFVRCFLETEEPFVTNDRGDVVIPLHLQDSLLADIYGNNAKRLLRSEPKPVDSKKAYAACQEIAVHRWDELSEMGKMNLETYLKFWKLAPVGIFKVIEKMSASPTKETIERSSLFSVNPRRNKVYPLISNGMEIKGAFCRFLLICYTSVQLLPTSAGNVDDVLFDEIRNQMLSSSLRRYCYQTAVSDNIGLEAECW